MKKLLIIVICALPTSSFGLFEERKTEKKTEQKAQEDLTKKTTEREKREEQKKAVEEAKKQHPQPEASPVKSAINALDTMLNKLAQEEALELGEKDIAASIKTYEDAYKTYEQSVKASESSVQRQKERLEQFEITFNATIGTFTIPERITLLRNLAAHFGTSTQQGSDLKDSVFVKTLIKSVLDSFSTVEHSKANPQSEKLNVTKAFENKKINETLRQAAAGLALSDDKILASAATDFAKKLAGWVNAETAQTKNISDALLSWIRIVVPKDKIIEVLSTVDFSKMAAANDPKMYEDWILLLKDLAKFNVPGIIAANVFTNYLNTVVKTGTPDDYISALEFLNKNFDAQQLASFLQPFTDFQGSLKKQLELLIANKHVFPGARLIKLLEKFASPETLMNIKMRFITDPRRTSKESLRALPREELYFIVTMLADMNKAGMKIDDITYGILSNIEAALNDVTAELEAFKKNKKFPKGFDNLSKEARQMFYNKSLTSAEKRQLGELQKQNNNVSATKDELINLITPWNFSFQKWEWVRRIFPKKVTFKYEPTFMQWDDDRISKELFNGVRHNFPLHESAMGEFIPSFDAFFKKWAYFSSEDPQFASIQSWLREQAIARFYTVLFLGKNPEIIAHLLKNPEMQKCFYDLKGQGGTSWLDYFVQQALPKKEDMRNISFPLFKIYIDNWFKDDRRPMTLDMALDYANTMTDTQLDYILKQLPINGQMLNRMANLQLTKETFEKVASPERRKKILETLVVIANELLQKEPSWAKSINEMIQLFNDELSKIKPAT